MIRGKAFSMKNPTAVYTPYQGDLPYVSISEVARKIYGEYLLGTSG